MPNKLSSPEKTASQVLLLFYPFRDEKELLSSLPPLYQNQLQWQGVLDVANKNKLKFKPYGDLVDQVYSKFKETFINNQDPHSQIECDKISSREENQSNLLGLSFIKFRSGSS